MTQRHFCNLIVYSSHQFVSCCWPMLVDLSIQVSTRENNHIRRAQVSVQAIPPSPRKEIKYCGNSSLKSSINLLAVCLVVPCCLSHTPELRKLVIFVSIIFSNISIRDRKLLEPHNHPHHNEVGSSNTSIYNSPLHCNCLLCRCLS